MNNRRKSTRLRIRFSDEQLRHLNLSSGARPAITEGTPIDDFSNVKWSWACRHLMEQCCALNYYIEPDRSRPTPADVALVQVEKVGYHRQIETEQERRLRLYQGDRLTCVFGNRYATDVYEGRVLGLDKLHLLTGSGVIGTVVSRNREVRNPTAVSFLGYLVDPAAGRVNLKELRFRPALVDPAQPRVVAVFGTGMSTGKTTVTRKIVHALVSQGVRVAACKLTGTASPRDLYELRAAGSLLATDFSDHGFPSTYGASLDELLRLFDSMLNACSLRDAQLVVVEIADGILQRETQLLLGSEDFRRRVSGVVLAGACSTSALYAAEYIQSVGLEVWAVSGLITNSPLFVQEFASRSAIPVTSSRAGGELARVVMEQIAPGSPESCLRQTADQVGC